MEILSRHVVGDMVAVYRTQDGAVDLVLHPVGLAPVVHRDAPEAEAVEGLVHLHVRGDSLANQYVSGRSMRCGGTILHLVGHDIGADGTVETRFRTDHGLSVRHRLRPYRSVLESSVAVANDGTAPLTIDLISSFALAGITPYASDDAPGRMVLHRWRSGWSLEGRLVSEPLEHLHLVPNYAGHGAAAERWGQIGTMPVRGWFPQVVAEDTEAGVCWGAQLAWGGSWQLEAYRRRDDLCLSGGLADREYGHWSITLAPGEELTTPVARVTVVRGGVDEACDRLVRAMDPDPASLPTSERDLPVIVNEWCTTWGKPTHDNVVALADWLRANRIDARYLVVDAGWFRPDDEAVDWYSSHGDWVASLRHFPDHLRATAMAIRDRGFVPGLWVEAESVGLDSSASRQTDHLLHRDGVPITVGVRRFWDLTDPWVVDYLRAGVTELLRSAGFGYLKLDDNETIGLGCDHPDSLGEGLRRQVLGSYAFLDSLHRDLPDLVIENCASGGHRLEPSYVGRTAMSSFSDAHEPPEIPIIAAALHRLLPPRQSQIWAVLKAADPPERTRYSLAAGFLGRLCLSGELMLLDEMQVGMVQEAVALYRRVAPVIADGTSRIHGDLPWSWRHPTGWQAVRRMASDDASCLVVAHSFAGCPPTVKVPLPGSGWRVDEAPYGPAVIADDHLVLDGLGEFDARVVVVRRGDPPVQ
jgi:alpha-galactosidase